MWNNKLQLEHPDREDEYDNAYHGKSSKLDSIDLKFQSGSAFFQSDPQLDHPDELDEYDKAYLGESSELDFVAQEYEEKDRAHCDLARESLLFQNSSEKISLLDKEETSAPSDILSHTRFQNCKTKPQKVVGHLQRPDPSLPLSEIKECVCTPIEEGKRDGVPTAKPPKNTIAFSSQSDLAARQLKFEKARAILLNEPFEASDHNTFSGSIEVSAPIVQTDNFCGEDPPEKEKEKNLALQLAEDFCQHMQIICVKRTLYLYNGSFYSPIQENELICDPV